MLSHSKLQPILSDTMSIMSEISHRSLDKNCSLPTLQSNPSEVVGFAILYSNKENEEGRVHISEVQVVVLFFET